MAAILPAPADAGANRAVASATDTLVARGRGISELYALDRTLLYRDRGGAKRLVAGTVRRARGLPSGRIEIHAVGRDAAGYVVATVRRWRAAGERFTGYDWFVYDITRDRAHALSVAAHPGCFVSAAAIWGTRRAWVERCGQLEPDEVPTATLMLNDGTRTWQFGGVLAPYGDERIVLRGRSLGSLGWNDGGDARVVRVMDRGRPCVPEREPVSGPPQAEAIVAFNDEGTWASQGIWIGASGIGWAMGNLGPDGDGRTFSDLAIMASPLSGRCGDPAPQGHLRAPSRPMRAVAVDGRRLYFAASTGIHRRRLPARPSTAPPANDEFRHAVRLGSRLPVHATAKVGHATRRHNEPDLGTHTRSAQSRTVWYAFTPTRSGTVHLRLWQTHGVFTGTRLDNLTAVPARPRPGATESLTVRARRTYWIMIAGGPDPSYEPIAIDLQRTPFLMTR